MSVNEKRQSEEKLVDAYRNIAFTSGKTEWISSDQFLAFLDSWKALREVYIVQDTFTDFNVEVIRVYLDITAYLRQLMLDDSLEQHSKESVSKALAQIEHWMNELIKEAQRNLSFIEDMDGEV